MCHRWLVLGGELHQIAFVVSDLDAALDRFVLRDLGQPALLSGSGFGVDGSGTYAYVDTAVELGYLVELFEPPTSLGEPDAVRGG